MHGNQVVVLRATARWRTSNSPQLEQLCYTGQNVRASAALLRSMTLLWPIWRVLWTPTAPSGFGAIHMRCAFRGWEPSRPFTSASAYVKSNRKRSICSTPPSAGTACRGWSQPKAATPSWQVVDRKAAEFLVAALPHLRIKRAQALLCLEMRELKVVSRAARFANGRGVRGGGARPAWISEEMERLCSEIRQLNLVSGRFARLAADRPPEHPTGQSASTIDTSARSSAV